MEMSIVKTRRPLSLKVHTKLIAITFSILHFQYEPIDNVARIYDLRITYYIPR